MTIEEQIQKSQSMAMMPEVSNQTISVRYLYKKKWRTRVRVPVGEKIFDVHYVRPSDLTIPNNLNLFLFNQSNVFNFKAEVEEEVDEMDDIDKIRDDLQSTKQMLALELRNKEAQIRENKRLQARLLNLEAELQKERANKTQDNSAQDGNNTADDNVVQSMKEEIVHAKKQAEDMEQKYHDTTDQLANAKFQLEEAKRQSSYLEKKLAAIQSQVKSTRFRQGRITSESVMKHK